MVALRDGEPDRDLVFVEGRILERMWRLEAIFALPRPAITGNVNVEDAPATILNAGVLLPAEVINFAKLVEGGFRVEAVRHEWHWLADGPCLAILSGGKVVVVAGIVAANGHPCSAGKTVHCRLAQLLLLWLIVMPYDFKGFIINTCHKEQVLI